MKKINININGLQIKVSPKLTVLQACLKHNIDVPSFCYHGELGFAGNCRMCLVEVSGAPKPVISCIFPVSEGLTINTSSAAVKKARETVIEFLLLNHPLDCPICDQAGECDLQELSYNFGSSNSRSLGFFREAVDDLNFNYSSSNQHSLIDIITRKGLKSKINVAEFEQVINPYMSRCILCTKCIRYERNISGISILGVFGRGSGSQIRVLDRGTFLNELSGNTIDLCPVGALTSKNYAFKGRPWDLINQSHIDIFDNYGTNIEIGYKNGNILRIAPRINNDLNNSWISDTIRYGYDSFSLTPLNYLNNKSKISKNQKLQLFSFKNFIFFNNSFKSVIPVFLNIGNAVSLMQIASLKNISVSFNIFNKNNSETIFDFNNNMPSFLFNRLKINKSSRSDFFLIGTDLRVTNPVLNSKLYQNSFNGLGTFYKFGSYDFNNLINTKFHGLTDLSFINSFLKGYFTNVSKKIFLSKNIKNIFFNSFALGNFITFYENFLNSKSFNLNFQYLPRYQNVYNLAYLNLKNHSRFLNLKKKDNENSVFFNVLNKGVKKNFNGLNFFLTPHKRGISLKKSKKDVYINTGNPYASFFNTLLTSNLYSENSSVIQKSLNSENALYDSFGYSFLYLFFFNASIASQDFLFRKNLKFNMKFYKVPFFMPESDSSLMNIFGKQSPFLRKTRQLKLRFRNNYGFIF